MQISLLDVTEKEGKELHVTVPFEMDAITFQLGTFPIVDRDPIQLDVINIGKKVLDLSGSCRVRVEVPCDRCLTPVQVDIPVSFTRRLDMKLPESELALELDENSYLTGTDLDTDFLVYLEILMSWPPKILCREDCAGLCSRCGKNLNDGPCGCSTQSTDPRMAAISELFRQYKEV
ncbi:MAG: DUF177 domain-containing protein [Blautia sp.]|nr:DUF177 domain-containing protein [Blautia sp.]